MNYSGSGFEMTLTDNTLVFSGKLEQSDEIRINNTIRSRAELCTHCVIRTTRHNGTKKRAETPLCRCVFVVKTYVMTIVKALHPAN